MALTAPVARAEDAKTMVRVAMRSLRDEDLTVWDSGKHPLRTSDPEWEAVRMAVLARGGGYLQPCLMKVARDSVDIHVAIREFRVSSRDLSLPYRVTSDSSLALVFALQVEGKDLTAQIEARGLFSTVAAIRDYDQSRLEQQGRIWSQLGRDKIVGIRKEN